MGDETHQGSVDAPLSPRVHPTAYRPLIHPQLVSSGWLGRAPGDPAGNHPVCSAHQVGGHEREERNRTSRWCTQKLEEMAVVAYRRLDDVAAQLGWSPDTVKRYVAVFRALNLIQHAHDRRGEVELRLPLGPYLPLPHFLALDALLTRRQKQRQLALKVKLSYMTHFGDPTHAYAQELRTALQELRALLESERLEPLKQQRLQTRLADLLIQLVGKTSGTIAGDVNHVMHDTQTPPEEPFPDQSFTQGDADEGSESSCCATEGKQRHPVRQEAGKIPLTGDLHVPGTPALQPHAPQQGDATQQQGDLRLVARCAIPSSLEQWGDSRPQQGDSLAPGLRPQTTPVPHAQQGQGAARPAEGDLHRQPGRPHEKPQGSKGDSQGQALLPPGDGQPVAADASPVACTYSVHDLIKSSSGNHVLRKPTAQFLAQVLEKEAYEHGYPTFAKYLKAFHTYRPEVIGRAFLVTMVLLHRKGWRVEKPGALFTEQCKILSGHKPLAHYTLDEVEAWMKAWGQLPYPDLIVALAPRQEDTPAVAAATSGAPWQRLTTFNGRQKRTYGLQYTGRPIVVNKGTNNLSGPTPPVPHMGTSVPPLATQSY